MDTQTIDDPATETAIPTPDITAPTPAKKQRGRPRSTPTPETPKQKAVETLQQKIERLQIELEKAHEAKKAADQNRDLIVGSVVTRHAFDNPEFRQQIAALLRSNVKNKSDLAAIAELLT